MPKFTNSISNAYSYEYAYAIDRTGIIEGDSPGFNDIVSYGSSR